MEESRWTCVVCGEREEYHHQLHLAEVLAELVAVCRKGRIWLQCMYSSCLQKVHLTWFGISSSDCECDSVSVTVSSKTSYAKTTDLYLVSVIPPPVFSEILFCSFFFQSLGPHCKTAGITTSFMQTSHCISNGIAYEIHGFFVNNALGAATTLLQVGGEASLLSSTKTALLRMLKERKK